ncbi:PREDICTED: piggyBac transposable element-derived protein 3-like [Diuraphis noxia]|uniref:piggyBac transposable element-derived protein 3-like n=1 Tax=Diuraphis noxia TaxID=143948 RepID=UPI000763B832|nr:PREDICTED: piggyBac transposable element-derived protein 3-like [Diuraphis noxia]
MGRGTTFEVSSDIPNSNIGLVKWYDNKPVSLGSNFITSGTPDEVSRYCKKEKRYISIKRPEIVKLYNQSMGGVDKYDQLISFFRTFMKSRKWTLRMVTHAFDMACVNSWLEYKMDCKHLNIVNKNIMDLLHFKERLAETLILVGNIVIRKRGRPRNSPVSLSPSPSSSPTPEMQKKIIKRIDQRPFNEVRHDNVGHLPDFDNLDNAVRCKYEGCKPRSHVFCKKCKVHLCFTKRNKCFTLYHNKNEVPTDLYF